MSVKLSIIVPIYGVEQYLRKCVDSLLNQDLDNCEIILVDDGSPDNCPAICDEYAERGKREEVRGNSCSIKVVHRENGGLSAARNSGIEVAQGEYLMFVDSDDYIEPNVLGDLFKQIERDQLDVLRFKYQNINEKYGVFQPYKRDHRFENDYSEEPTDGVTFLNERMNTQCYAWAFIIKRSLIYNDGMSREQGSLNEPHALNDVCLFKEGIYFEDTEWTPRMMVRAKKVASTETIVYNYLVREGSITNAVNKSKQKKVLDDKMRLIETMQKQSEELLMQSKDNQWFAKMIADTVISIITILGTQFYSERKEYLVKLKSLGIYPIQSRHYKARLINISPLLAVALLHLKNS